MVTCEESPVTMFPLESSTATVGFVGKLTPSPDATGDVAKVSWYAGPMVVVVVDDGVGMLAG